MKNQDSVDSVIIGSSPICLLESLHQRRLGKRVVLLEREGELGGAWKDLSVFGLQRVEIAPHVMMYNKGAYEFLSDMGVPMQAMVPQPVYLIKTRWGIFRLAYHLSPFLSYITVPYHYLTSKSYRERFSEFKTEYLGRFDAGIEQLFSWIFCKEKPRLQYPAGGTTTLMQRLVEEVYSQGVEVRLYAKVEGLCREDGGALAVSVSGETILAKDVWMTKHQKVATSGLSGAPLIYRDKEFHSLHLLFRTEEAMDISFVLMKGDPKINLVSDLTPYCEGLDNDQKVVVVRFHEWAVEKGSNEVGHFFEHMRSLGLVPKSAVLEDYSFDLFWQGSYEKESYQALEEMGGDALTIFKSTNFSDSIGEQVPRWRKSIKSHTSARLQQLVER